MQAAPASGQGGTALAIVGMIAGILSIVLVWVPFLDFLLGGGALVTGILARRRGARGFGLAAFILGIIGLAIGVIYTIIWVIAEIVANTGG